MEKLDFLAGIEFEQCYRSILTAIRDYPRETDSSERRSLIDWVELSYTSATKFAERYDARDLLTEHIRAYNQFQNLIERESPMSIALSQDNHRIH